MYSPLLYRKYVSALSLIPLSLTPPYNWNCWVWRCSIILSSNFYYYYTNEYVKYVVWHSICFKTIEICGKCCTDLTDSTTDLTPGCHWYCWVFFIINLCKFNTVFTIYLPSNQGPTTEKRPINLVILPFSDQQGLQYCGNWVKKLENVLATFFLSSLFALKICCIGFW